MSRHLMARFRHLAATQPFDWQHGVSIPHPQTYWENPIWNPRLEEHSTALVNHGERRYALQVKKLNDEDRATGRSKYGPWFWSVHQQTGPDIGNHEDWEWAGQRAFQVSDETGVRAFSDTREEAMRHAETAWRHYTGSQEAKRDQAFDDGLRDHRDPEGGYDIFGERP